MFEYGFDFGADGDVMPQGEWIELYNLSSSPIDISGWHLEDADSNVLTITSGNADNDGDTADAGETTIPANGYLVVYDNSIFSLNNDGDTIKLYNASGAIVDEYTYDLTGACDLEPTQGGENDTSESGTCNSEVPGNKSYARIPDGVGDFVDPIPTPLAPNTTDEDADTKTQIVIVYDPIIGKPEDEVVIEEHAIVEEQAIIENTKKDDESGEPTPDDEEEDGKEEDSTLTTVTSDGGASAEPVDPPADEDVDIESKEEDVTPSETIVTEEEPTDKEGDEVPVVEEDEIPTVEEEVAEPVEEVVVSDETEEIPQEEVTEEEVVVDPVIKEEVEEEELPVIEMEAPEVVKLTVVEEKDEEESIIIEPIEEEPVIIEPETVPEEVIEE